MISQNQIKFVNSLKNKKYRFQHGAFIVEGEKCVNELLLSHIKTKLLFATEAWLSQQNLQLLHPSINIITIQEHELKKISDLVTPNKVLAIAEIQDENILDKSFLQKPILALDGIRDPGNLGTMIRTANWFGINTIVCSKDCVDFYNPKVIQATMGSFAKVKIKYLELESFLNSAYKQYPVYGAMLNAPALSDNTFQNNGILVIGSESHGISEKIKPYITHPIQIPHFTKQPDMNTAESLNASIACGILCFEFAKKH